MNGLELEQLVGKLERSFLPPDFAVEARRREFAENGIQLAEFDLVITGRIGSASVSWLCECRDRPSDGPAPGAWIEQLAGRRLRFNFDKVMAVSTTGFAPGAVDYARQVGIDLRNVSALTPDAMQDWLRTGGIETLTRHIHLSYFNVVLFDTEPPEHLEAARQAVGHAWTDDPLLRDPAGVLVRPTEAFRLAVEHQPQLWPETPTANWSRDVEIEGAYTPDQRYQLPTSVGPIQVPWLVFRGSLSYRTTFAWFTHFSEYANAITGERIACTSSAEFTVAGQAYIVSLHRAAIDGKAKISASIRERK